MVVQKIKDYTENKSIGFNGVFAVLIVVLVFLIDWTTGFDGFNVLAIPWARWLSGVVSVAGIAFLAWNFLTHWSNKKLAIASSVLVLLFLLFGITNFGDMNWLRLLLLFINFHVFIQPTAANDEEKSRMYYTYSALMLADYLFLGFVDVNRYYFPLYLWYVSVHFFQRSGNIFFKIIFVLTIAFTAFALGGGKQLFLPGIQNINPAERTGFVNTIIAFGAWIKGVPFQIKQSYHQFRQQTFNSSYYSGTQEDPPDPQGVFLTELDRGELNYRTDSPVYVWARLEAKTLDERINGVISCYIENEDEELEPILGVIEDPEIDVLSGVERTIPCRFDGLEEGDYDVIFKADFDFSADARKKVYLMDRERMISDFEVLIDKGGEPTKADVLKQLYDIQDTEPESIVTSGPISVAIATDNVPWDIGQSYNFRPLFGVTIENLWDDGGVIKQINTIELKVPSEMSIEKCDQDDMANSGNEEGFKVYIVRPNPDLIQDVEDFVSINCIMNVGQNSLDNTPVTTRFLKVHVDYEFVLEEKIDIEVEGYGFDEEGPAELSKQLCCKLTSPTGATNTFSVGSEQECVDRAGTQAGYELFEVPLESEC